MSDLVLIVEDESEWQELLSSILARACLNYKLAEDYEAALQELRDSGPSAVLLDLKLPTRLPLTDEFPGWDIAREALIRNIPVIIVTGHPSVDRARDAFRRYKAIDFLDKATLTPELLVKSVSEAVEYSHRRQLSANDKRGLLEQFRIFLSEVLSVPAGTGDYSDMQRLAERRENLRLIEERKAQYVQETEIPLTLIKDERRLKEEIAEIESRLKNS